MLFNETMLSCHSKVFNKTFCNTEYVNTGIKIILSYLLASCLFFKCKGKTRRHKFHQVRFIFKLHTLHASTVAFRLVRYIPVDIFFLKNLSYFSYVWLRFMYCTYRNGMGRKCPYNCISGWPTALKQINNNNF